MTAQSSKIGRGHTFVTRAGPNDMNTLPSDKDHDFANFLLGGQDPFYTRDILQPNITHIFSNLFGKSKAESDNLKYQSYQIQGSQLSSDLNCKEDADGTISCELPDQVISYRVEDLSVNGQVIDDHMNN